MSDYLNFDGLDQILKSISARFGNYLTATQINNTFATIEALEAILELGATPTGITSDTLTIGGTAFNRTINLADNQLRNATWNPATGDLIITQQGGANININIPSVSTLISNVTYDAVTKEVVFTRQDGTSFRVDVGDLVDVYVGSVAAAGTAGGVTIALTGNVFSGLLIADAVRTAHIQNSQVTLVKMANMASTNVVGGGRIMGRSQSTAGPPQDLTPAAARTILNIADGATANEGTVTSVGATTNGLITIGGTATTTPTVGLSAIAAWTIIGNATTGAAVPTALTAANVMRLIASGQTTNNNTSYVLSRGASETAWSVSEMPSIPQGTLTDVLGTANRIDVTGAADTRTVNVHTNLIPAHPGAAGRMLVTGAAATSANTWSAAPTVGALWRATSATALGWLANVAGGQVLTSGSTATAATDVAWSTGGAAGGIFWRSGANTTAWLAAPTAAGMILCSTSTSAIGWATLAAAGIPQPIPLATVQTLLTNYGFPL